MLGTPSTCSAAGADRLLSATARRPPIAEYYVHGRGRGHASRGKTMVQALEQYGYHVCVFVDPDVAAMVQSVGSERVAVTSMPVGASLPSVWRSFTTLLSRFFMDADCSICQRREYSPDVIVTDGDFPGAWRAVRADIPAVAVGHGYVFSSTNRPAFASKEPWRAQRRLNKRTTDLADCTVGVSYYPLSPTNNHTIIAKPRLRDQFLRLERRVPARPRIVTYFRDEGVGAEVLDVLAATGYEILAFGTGSAVTTTRSGVRVLPFDETLFLNSLAEASAVVGTSGDNLIAESMTLGIPMLGLYRAGDDEQQLNAEMLEHAGFGLKSSFEDLNASLIQHFLDNLDLFTGSAPTTNWQAPDAVAATFECIKKVSHRAREWHRHLDGLDEDMVGPVAEARRRLLLEPPRAVTASPPPVVADAAAAALQAVSNQQAERAADAAEADVSFEFFGV
ncbi:uncharacterized protein MONBRDRAFT_25126 [Monosiga brevicollis MX1]|uniref:Glycosyl transferase family 28 C-terminal domain-containing protein n=1 Tax=Monosiga brevicollis TaxID=81824 RepID=A9UYH5_MONBE|nr:uncharacterized protein MONBRDRAFT_25126 [Monosiga brevicollis MX1]EDQ89462.1 predicted protein [Monosiga brevicollis MX1]|eukprot:XP_001745491.1 hypothetical protein [Monosiga brevicollis MX1]